MTMTCVGWAVFCGLLGWAGLFYGLQFAVLYFMGRAQGPQL